MSAPTGIDILEPEDEPAAPAPGPLRWAVVIASGATLIAGAVLAALVWSPEPGAGAARGSSSPPEQPTSTPVASAPAPAGTHSPVREFAGATLGEAVPALEAAGARVVTFDARAWGRSVAPEWRICTQTPTFLGTGEPTGEIHLAAVPPGDPCD